LAMSGANCQIAPATRLETLPRGFPSWPVPGLTPTSNCFYASIASCNSTRSSCPDSLHGIPVAIKDLVAVRGEPMTCGSKLLAGNVAVKDATVAARLRAAGAIEDLDAAQRRLRQIARRHLAARDEIRSLLECQLVKRLAHCRHLSTSSGSSRCLKRTAGPTFRRDAMKAFTLSASPSRALSRGVRSARSSALRV